MSESTSKFIDIALISNNPQNYRHVRVGSSDEALQQLLRDIPTRRHKIIELASDIVEQGMLDPSSKLIVMEDADNLGHYIVLEGNRRIAALKALANPELAKGYKSYGSFKKLSGKFLALNLTQVECVIQTPKQAKTWISRKHDTGLDGKGTESWSAIGTALSSAEDGQIAPWLAVCNFLTDNDVNIDYIMDGIEQKTTSVTRVLGSAKNTSDVLGFSIKKDGSILPEIDDKEKLISLLTELMLKMADPNFKEPDVSRAEDQVTFLEKFIQFSCKRPTTKKSGSETSGAEHSSSNSNANQNSSSQGNQGPSPKSSNATQPVKRGAKQRKKLAQPGLIIGHPQLAAFYNELRKLPCDTYPHAAASTLRVFIEKATVVFLQENNVSLPNPNCSSWEDFSIKLRIKIASALKEIDPQKKNLKLMYVRQVASGGAKGSIHDLDYLNHYIHDQNALPAATELITAWDRYHPYLVELFESLSEGNI